jgi:hypothetical protein
LFETNLINNLKVIDILLKYKIVDVIKEHNNSIAKKIDSLEKEIVKRKIHIDDILDI